MNVLLIYLSVFIAPFLHDFHISMAILNWDEEERIVKISQKIFYDDCENAIRLHYNKPDLKLDEYLETGEDSVFQAYFLNHFNLSDGKKNLDISWLGCELQGIDLLWFYAEVPIKRIPKNLVIQSNILTELFDDQANIILLKKFPFSENRLHLDSKETGKTLIQ